MSVIIEKDIAICNEKKIDMTEILKIQLEKKQQDFFENIFPKYSNEEKASYMWRHEINFLNPVSVLGTIFGFILVFIVFPFYTFINIYISFLFLFLGVILSYSSLFSFFHKFTVKRWLSKKVNESYLENEMFWDSIVDKETMKYVVQCYGKEHFVNLMKGKESLKYKDIFFYVKKLDNECSQTANLSESSEIAKLSKVAECLLKD